MPAYIYMNKMAKLVDIHSCCVVCVSTFIVGSLKMNILIALQEVEMNIPFVRIELQQSVQVHDTLCK